MTRLKQLCHLSSSFVFLFSIVLLSTHAQAADLSEAPSYNDCAVRLAQASMAVKDTQEYKDLLQLLKNNEIPFREKDKEALEKLLASGDHEVIETLLGKKSLDDYFKNNFSDTGLLDKLYEGNPPTDLITLIYLLQKGGLWVRYPQYINKIISKLSSNNVPLGYDLFVMDFLEGSVLPNPAVMSHPDIIEAYVPLTGYQFRLVKTMTYPHLLKDYVIKNNLYDSLIMRPFLKATPLDKYYILDNLVENTQKISQEIMPIVQVAILDENSNSPYDDARVKILNFIAREHPEWPELTTILKMSISQGKISLTSSAFLEYARHGKSYRVKAIRLLSQLRHTNIYYENDRPLARIAGIDGATSFNEVAPVMREKLRNSDPLIWQNASSALPVLASQKQVPLKVRLQFLDEIGNPKNGYLYNAADFKLAKEYVDRE